jgi:hypothetical protein
MLNHLKLTVFITAILLLTGCTNKTVYLFNNGYPQESVDEVAVKLINLGYDVEHVNAEIPAEFSDTAIATHPVVAAPADLPIIENILKESEFPTPSYYQFAQGNHFYSPDSFGLYLRNGYQKIMPPIMGDISCFVNGDSVDATLEFRRSGEVILEVELYREGKLLKNSYRKHTGKYTLINNRIQLDFIEFKTGYLAINETKIQTYSGGKKADHLVIKSQKNNSPIENCLFEAVYY